MYKQRCAQLRWRVRSQTLSSHPVRWQSQSPSHIYTSLHHFHHSLVCRQTRLSLAKTQLKWQASRTQRLQYTSQDERADRVRNPTDGSYSASANAQAKTLLHEAAIYDNIDAQKSFRRGKADLSISLGNKTLLESSSEQNSDTSYRQNGFQSTFFNQPTLTSSGRYLSPLDVAVDDLLQTCDEEVVRDEKHVNLDEKSSRTQKPRSNIKHDRDSPRQSRHSLGDEQNLSSENGITFPGTSSKLRSKVDLSHYNVYKREAQALVEPEISETSMSTTFRDNAGLRRVLGKFVSLMAPWMQSRAENCFEYDDRHPLVGSLDKDLREIFNTKSMQLLTQRGFVAEDVMSWAWVLNAQTNSRKIKRYAMLARDARQNQRAVPPTFVLMQLLRLETIDAPSLHLLWSEADHMLSTWKTNNNEDTAIILLIRFLRHARYVDVNMYQKVVDLAVRLLPSNQDKEFDILRAQRLTHFYNRLLTLLAHPVPNRPFDAVPIQQKAQLSIARFMQKCRPQLPINREGYRALVDLQLRHAKTVPEREWAKVKSPSWPPWRKDQLGIDEKREYPGRFSRAMKVLLRMQEAGYSFDQSDHATQILAGWDTDKSPTIQTRRQSPKRMMPWLKSRLLPDSDNGGATADHEVWAARVHATRTIREAWSCFHRYMGVTENGERKLNVYQAMLEKLLANPIPVTSDPTVVAGDGREVWPDPIAPRDQVYVPVEPLSLDELYAQMIGEGLKPPARLLAGLLTKVSTIEQGLQYISDSTLDEQKRDVLCHAERYPSAMIRSVISSVPQYVFGAFLKLLARRSSREARLFRAPGSQSFPKHSSHTDPVRCLDYAEDLLEISETKEVQPYNSLVDGIRRQVNSTLKQSARYHNEAPNFRRAAVRLWPSVLRTIELMKRNDVIPSMNIFRNVASIAQSLTLLAPSVAQIPTFALSDAPSLVRRLFVQVLMEQTNHHDTQGTQKLPLQLPAADVIRKDVLPDCLDLELVFLSLAELADTNSTLNVLRWMSEGQAALRLDRCTDHHRMYMMVAARIALSGNGQFDDSQSMRSDDQFMELALKFAEPFGWPTDDDVKEYLEVRQDQYAVPRRVIGRATRRLE